MALEDKDINQLKQLKEIVDYLIDFSQANIIKVNFIESFYKYTINDVLYGNYRLFGAKSFRLTSNSPNMLNAPSTGSIYAKPIKRCFRAVPGKIFYMVDLSALEDRVIANLSRDKNKLSVFTEGVDGHCLNSYYYFKDKIEAILPREENEELYPYIKRYHKAIEDGDKDLKAIRQKSKNCTFALSYGCFPKKLAATAKISLEEAEAIHEKYHTELYPDISKFREKVLNQAVLRGKVHLGLGCYINTSDPHNEIRTTFNACSQFWSILTLLTINALHQEIDNNELQERIQIISSIYDSIYIHLDDDLELIKWVNDTIIPFLTKDFLKDQIVHNEATGEIGYNWFDTVAISNNASLEEIEEARNKARELIK